MLREVLGLRWRKRQEIGDNSLMWSLNVCSHQIQENPDFTFPYFAFYVLLYTFLYGSGQMPVREAFPVFYAVFMWSLQKHEVRVLLHHGLCSVVLCLLEMEEVLLFTGDVLQGFMLLIILVIR